MSEALQYGILALTGALLLAGLILAIVVVLRNWNTGKPEFETVRSEGTEARTFLFTGKKVATERYTEVLPPRVVVRKLYETPSGMYRVVYSNGNVSFRKSKDEICNTEPRLARNAGLSRVIHLDVYEDDKGKENGWSSG